MSELNKLIRYLIPADKEGAIQNITAEPVGPHTKFTSQLTLGHKRKTLQVYNNSNSDSGDSFYGFGANMSPSGDSMPLAVGTRTQIDVGSDQTAIDLYFCAASGEHGDLRIEELA